MIRALVIPTFLVLYFSPLQPAVTCSQLRKTPETVKGLINDFTSADWQKVHVAEAAMESRQAEVIPALIELLDRDKKVELHNTADLIYPGAKTFYGHGWILDYDLDWIPVRAGWALEELTFQNFGFREGTVNEANLMKAVLTEQRDVRLADSTKTPDVKRMIRTEAASRARSWWQKTQNSWNRFDAVVEALRSDDPVRQLWTLNWIRHGRTKCDRLTLDSFKRYIVPEAERLLKSNNQGVREQAEYLLEDKAGWWLKYKTEGNPR